MIRQSVNTPVAQDAPMRLGHRGYEEPIVLSGLDKEKPRL